MSDDLQIGGHLHLGLIAKAPRGSRQANPKRRAFTKAKQQLFLSHFAATCNAREAAEQADIGYSTVYAQRRKDPAFRTAWHEALEHGYAQLEAALLRRAIECLQVDIGDAPEPAITGMDAKTAFNILQNYKRSLSAPTGDIQPRTIELQSVRNKLEKEMRTLRIIDAEGRLIESGVKMLTSDNA